MCSLLVGGFESVDLHFVEGLLGLYSTDIFLDNNKTGFFWLNNKCTSLGISLHYSHCWIIQLVVE